MDKFFIVKLQSKLIAEESVSQALSGVLAASVMNDYAEEVKAAVVDWVEGKDVTSFSLNDTTVGELMENLKCTAFEALGILNALNKDPGTFRYAVLRMRKDAVRE